MAEYFFIAAHSLVKDFAEGGLAEDLPSMFCHGISIDARAQLYSLLTSRPLDVSYEMEIPVPMSEEISPAYYQLDNNLVDQFSQLDEGSANLIMEDWLATKDLEEIESDTTDPTDFLLTLIHFCNIATQERDLGIFLFSEG